MKKFVVVLILIFSMFIAGCRVNNTDDTTDGEKTGMTGNNKLNIQVGNTMLTATLTDNSSADALKELLEKEPLTIDMSDYNNMEKVGNIGTDLPRNDEQISTGPGDLILYQGNSFVIYYSTNSWSLTRLGKIDGVTDKELKEILGDGDVTVTLSLV